MAQAATNPTTPSPASAALQQSSDPAGGFTYDKAEQNIRERDTAVDAANQPYVQQAQKGIEEYDIMRQGYSEHLNDELQHINEVAQRQRFITMQRGVDLKTFLPIAAAFALIGGRLAGAAGALSGMAGALAGYSQGRTDAYNRAYDQWKSEMDSVLAEAKQTDSALSDIMKDASTSATQKIDLLKTVSTHNAVLAKDLNTLDISKAHAAVEMQAARTRAYEQNLKRTSQALKPPAAGELKLAGGLLGHLPAFTPPHKPTNLEVLMQSADMMKKDPGNVTATQKQQANMYAQYDKQNHEYQNRLVIAENQVASLGNVIMAKNPGMSMPDAYAQAVVQFQSQGNIGLPGPMAPKAKEPVQISPEKQQLINDAKAAIKSGKQKSGVIAILKKNGVSDAEMQAGGLE